MNLSVDIQDDVPRSAADKFSYQVSQALGQIMQLVGIASIEYSVSSKGFLPNKTIVSHMDTCPPAVKDIADDIAQPMSLLMREFNITKLFYDYGKEDIDNLRPSWEEAAKNIGSEELLVAPDVTPDMERIDIQL